MTQLVVTRFAPSPTGFLHIGGARTALFNWLFARHHGGEFKLRIEDTDRARSSDAATKAITDGLTWLGLDWDGPAISQFGNAARHAEVAHQLLEAGKAYKCYSTQAEIASFRELAQSEKRSTLFISPWRDAGAATHPDAPYAIRLRTPNEGKTVVCDRVQGDVTIRNDQLDDMILLRSDGTPVYMLAVVVDDFDMGVTHVIRGDDHLNNAARQMGIYTAMGWPLPVYAHIPLIHGADGRKLSKRHGALGVGDYQQMGYPAAGMRNYLARLGWSHGDDEFFTDEQAIQWFDLTGIGKSPARFDFKKLDNLSGRHIAVMDDAALRHEYSEFRDVTGQKPLTPAQSELFDKAACCLKERAKTYLELTDKAEFILTERPVFQGEKSAGMLDNVSRGILNELTPHLQNATWSREEIEAVAMRFAEDHEMKFGKLAGPLRAALAGRSATPSVFDMMLVLGRDETIARLSDAANGSG